MLGGHLWIHLRQVLVHRCGASDVSCPPSKKKKKIRRKIKEKSVFLVRKFGNSAVGEFRSKR